MSDYSDQRRFYGISIFYKNNGNGRENLLKSVYRYGLGQKITTPKKIEMFHVSKVVQEAIEIFL